MHARTQRSLYSYEENERPIRPMDMQEEHHYVVEKNNDSFLRSFFSPSLSLLFSPRALRVSLHLFLSIIVTVIFNQKLPPESLDRCVCPILLIQSPAIPFRPASVSFSSFSSRSYHPVSSFAAVVALGWHRSARSNLISSCKFNYWLTAPRRRALYLLLASPQASRYSCLGRVLILFFFFSFSPSFSLHAANKPISAYSLFLRASSGFGFSAKLCGEHDCS